MAKKSKPNSVVSALNNVLADYYLLTLKTHGFHWNVEGPNFHGLHIMLEEQYNQLFKTADEVAERIRAIGEKAPASFAQFSKMSAIEEAEEMPSNADGMLKALIADYGTLTENLEEGIKLAEEAEDADTQDLFTRVLHDANKNAWMLKATAKK
jgi:starvation-inducible DNA-binding protein